MKKNTVLLIISIVVSVMMVITSCDKIDPPYVSGNTDSVTGDTVRKLLFEDFTGHECVNCPSAHKTIEDLQKVYGDRIIVIAEHIGFFAKPKAAPFDYDFRTPEGKEISTFFGAYDAPPPKGMVNRNKVNGSYLIDKAEFGTAISLVLDSMPEKPDILIQIIASYNSSDSTIGVDAKLTALTNLPAGKYNLSILVTESEIIEAQKNSDANVGDIPEILNYNHKHVLRGAINTTWGEEFTNGAISNGQTFSKAYSNYKIGKDWNPDNIHIVAFAYYADGPNEKVVIQAEQVDLK
jgi:thiol-disulfide isomerase/thioredoxin